MKLPNEVRIETAKGHAKTRPQRTRFRAKMVVSTGEGSPRSDVSSLGPHGYVTAEISMVTLGQPENLVNNMKARKNVNLPCQARTWSTFATSHGCALCLAAASACWVWGSEGLGV